MMELLDRPLHPPAESRAAAHEGAAGWHTPAAAPVADVFAAMLDEVDYPMVLVDRSVRLLHANKSARHHLDEVQGGAPAAGGLQLRCAADHAALCRAVEAACVRGLRSFIDIGGTRGRHDVVAVVPQRDRAHGQAALLMFGRPRLCEDLSVFAFARKRCLTAGETRVLGALCAGLSAQAIARSHGVALSTVRTQVSSLRAKTGARHIGDLLRKMAVLPPLVNALEPARGALC